MVVKRPDWTAGLECWLEPFLNRLAHKTRRRMCPLYISGLIGPGDRKSVQPMAERVVPGGYDQLHHFVAAGVWEAAPLEAELLIQAAAFALRVPNIPDATPLSAALDRYGDLWRASGRITQHR